MRILLLGEYSNVHNTLARGLRALGHEVVVASNGDYWKNYPRDIDFDRPPGKMGGISLMARVLLNLTRMRGFDIVQIINPLFLELKADKCRKVYDWLLRHNRKVVMCAFGMDYYWVKCSDEMIFRYGDFNIGSELRHNLEAEHEREDWLGTDKGELNKHCAETADSIVSGLYEYDAVYRPLFPDKTVYIPFPVCLDKEEHDFNESLSRRIRMFIGISKSRSAYKGTDIMLKAAEDLVARYPDKVELQVACGIPFAEYRRMMLGSDMILDQLYSYTPAMNALEAMSHGIICVGGGEPENYDILNEKELRPIINVHPCYQSVYDELEQVILHPERIPELKRQSIEYITRHHEYIKVARQYESLYLSL